MSPVPVHKKDNNRPSSYRGVVQKVKNFKVIHPVEGGTTAGGGNNSFLENHP